MPGTPSGFGGLKVRYQRTLIEVNFGSQLGLLLQEPEAWEILKDLEKIADEYDSRCGS